jgi:molecular chaperone GrpE (heat shock protein)
MDATSAENGPEPVTQDDLGATGSEAEPWTKISAGLIGLQEAFDAKIRYDRVQEQQIAALHQELEAHRRGLYQQILKPVLIDIVGLYDDIAKMNSGSVEAGAQIQQAGAFARERGFLLDSIEEILQRYGVIMYACDSDAIDRSRQRVIDVMPTDNADLDRRVARRVRPGFEVDGKILRPEWVVAYRYSSANENPVEEGQEALTSAYLRKAGTWKASESTVSI